MWNSQVIRHMALRAYGSLRLRAAAAGTFACVWWGILYPELCFTDSTCEQVAAADSDEAETENRDSLSILDVSGDGIVIKSRLLEWIEEKINK